MNITDKEKIRRDLLKMGFSLEAIEKFLKGGSK